METFYAVTKRNENGEPVKPICGFTPDSEVANQHYKERIAKGEFCDLWKRKPFQDWKIISI